MQLVFWEEAAEEDVVDDGLDTHSLGRAGQYLVAADLELAGYPCSIASESLPYDLVVDVGGVLLRVQVKATRNAQRHSPPGRAPIPCHVFSLYKRGQQSCDRVLDGADVFALVALSRRAATYVRAREMPRSKNVRVQDKYFADEALRALSLSHALGIDP